MIYTVPSHRNGVLSLTLDDVREMLTQSELRHVFMVKDPVCETIDVESGPVSAN